MSTYLTAEGIEKLRLELEQLETVALPNARDIVLEAKTAGDNSENSDFFNAKTEEAILLGRAKLLRSTLASAVVVDANDVSVAGPGTVVSLDFGDGDLEHMFIGNIEMTAATELDVLTADSPLGRAVIGASVGDEVSYESPSGQTLTVTVADISVGS